MRRTSVIENITLDGIMQSPGRPDEDTRNGFAQGGWASRCMDQVAAEEMGRGQQEASEFGSVMLFGRITYTDFATVWPAQVDNPLTEFFANIEKYVVSNTLPDELPWVRAHVLRGDGVDEIRKLKETEGPDLIDTYTLSIHPLILGKGFRLFDRSDAFSSMRLVRSVPTTTGVIIATYEVERPQ
jgi:dihydrofolate reductase